MERKPMIELAMLVVFGSALCGATGVEILNHRNSATAPPCRQVWQQYWDIHACARDFQRCSARVTWPSLSEPCVEHFAAERRAT